MVSDKSRSVVERYEGHVEDALHTLQNERVVMYVDPNGYSSGIRATHVIYVWHEAGSYHGILDDLFGSERGRVSERKVKSLYRQHGCAFVDPQEVPDYVR